MNHHAYAACMHGSFLRREHDVPEGACVLLLLRARHLKRCLRALRLLRDRGARVFIAWKEAGTFQVARALASSSRWLDFCALAVNADGAIASTPDLPPLYSAAGCRAAPFLPTPYPIGEPGWDFAKPAGARVGVFIGTRDFAEPSRNHGLALACAASLGAPVCVINIGGSRDRELILRIAPEARVVEGPLPYPKYLELMASHRIVFQLDRGAVPGQIAGDAALCGMPCVGGDGAIERLVFPRLCSHGASIGELMASARLLLADEHAWRAAVEDAAERVREISFPAMATRLAALAA